ncbi:MAG: hypothetical protein QM608_10685 [Caulobacter sp.]
MALIDTAGLKFLRFQGRGGSPAPFKLSVEGRCAEARVLAADIDLDLALLAPRDGPGADGVDRDQWLKRLSQGFHSPYPSEQIAAAVDLRKWLVCGYDRDRLLNFLPQLRERYDLAMGPQAKSALIDPSAAAAPATAEMLRAEALSLLEGLKLLYTLSSERELLTSRIRRTALNVLGGLFVVLVITMFMPLLTSGGSQQILNIVANYAVIAVVGAAGAMVSVLRRTESAMASASSQIDPVRQVSALRQGVMAVLIAAFVGTAVSYVMLAFFASGLLTASGVLGSGTSALFPKLADAGTATPQIGFMSHRLRFVTFADTAKMLVWAFVGGFSEQLIPDVLDRLTKAARPSKSSSAA